MAGKHVRDIMRTKPVTISASERMSTVEDIMTLGRVRHMPVVQAGRLVGVVSERDLLRASLSVFSEHLEDERRAFLHIVAIDEVMSTPPVTIDPEASIEEAALLMARRRIGCLPVLQGDRLIGLLTETDVLRWVAGLAPLQT
jgi:CBS domain-containing protein